MIVTYHDAAERLSPVIDNLRDHEHRPHDRRERRLAAEALASLEVDLTETADAERLTRPTPVADSTEAFPPAADYAAAAERLARIGRNLNRSTTNDHAARCQAAEELGMLQRDLDDAAAIEAARKPAASPKSPAPAKASRPEPQPVAVGK